MSYKEFCTTAGLVALLWVMITLFVGRIQAAECYNTAPVGTFVIKLTPDTKVNGKKYGPFYLEEGKDIKNKYTLTLYNAGEVGDCSLKNKYGGLVFECTRRF